MVNSNNTLGFGDIGAHTPHTLHSHWLPTIRAQGDHHLQEVHPLSPNSHHWEEIFPHTIYNSHHWEEIFPHTNIISPTHKSYLKLVNIVMAPCSAMYMYWCTGIWIYPNNNLSIDKEFWEFAKCLKMLKYKVFNLLFKDHPYQNVQVCSTPCPSKDFAQNGWVWAFWIFYTQTPHVW